MKQLNCVLILMLLFGISVTTYGQDMSDSQSLQDAVIYEPATIDTADRQKKNLSLPEEPSIPYWVRELKVNDPARHYFGIGMSTNAVSEADDNARIEFSKSVEVQVDAQVKQEISEKGRKVTEAFDMKNTVMSKMILRGIYITDRWQDPDGKKFYSLIQVNRDDYNKLIQEEIEREAARQEAMNRYEEKKRIEELRHKESLVKLEKDQTELALKEKKQKDELREAKKKHKQDHIDHVMRTYGQYNTFQPHYRLADMKNAEISAFKHSISVKGSLNHPGFVSADYGLSMWNIVGISLMMSMDDERLDRQDATIKLKLLNGVGKMYRVSAALSFSQYINELPVIYKFRDFETISLSPEYTLGGMVNVSVPRLYSTVCFQADKRRISLGMISHPLFMHLDEYVGVLFQVDYFPRPFYRNRYNDKWQIQPGFQFMVLPDRFYATIAYEDNHMINLGLDIHL